MKLVLLSGGSGKRLWPLSNDARAKQFLKVLDGETPGKTSMVQRVWGQLQNTGLEKDTLIATSQSQVDMIQSQLGTDASYIVEPERRDTFPAIALAASYLYSVKETPLQETVVILPVDPYVEDRFFTIVQELETALDQSNADIGLVGVKPTYPSSKYGYIVPSAQEKGYKKVSHFQEKPSEEHAASLIKQDALWNCAVFAFKLDYMINVLEKLGLPLQYEELKKQYHKLPKTSFDYAVVEKASSVIAVPYEGYWKDLGTWNTLTEEMKEPVVGRGKLSLDSTNTHIINELDIPINVLGMPDAVITASPDGILVTSKEASPRVKEMLNDHSERPMFEERRWGSYKVVDYAKYSEKEEAITKRTIIKAGENSSYHFHHNCSETWMILRGEGELALGEDIKRITQGDIVQVPRGVKHGLRGITDIEFIEVQRGSLLNEESIQRITSCWEEVTAACYQS